ncbi:MAG: DUF4038 domain-containing protein [Terracidiphilus sp.]
MMTVAALLSFLCQKCIAAQGQESAAAAQPSVAQVAAYPLKLSPNRRYLVDRNDKPFLIVGDSPQGLIGRLSETEADAYFADRQAHGFNTAGWIDVACAGRDFPDNKTGSTPDGILPFTGFVSGGTDYTHYDLSKPNETYFVRLDHVVELAAKHSILVFIDPMETIGWLPTLRNNGLAASYAYGQYLGRRYKNFNNVAWISGNDFNNWRVPSDDALALAVAKGIQSVDPDQLQSVEINVFTSSSLDDQSWASIISLNGTYTYSATYIQMLHSYNQTPVMPAYLLEAHYDLEQVGVPTDYGTPDVLRRQEYWTMLSGGVGQFYGNRYTWSLTPGWVSYIDTLGVTQLTIWKGFFLSLPWQDLVPDQEHMVLRAGYGTFGSAEVEFDRNDLTAKMKPRVSQSDYATAARTPDGAFIVAYMPTARAITVNMASLKSPAKAKWFDPTNGAYTIVHGGPFANRGSRQFAPPGNNHAGDSDWALVLDASGAPE